MIGCVLCEKFKATPISWVKEIPSENLDNRFLINEVEKLVKVLDLIRCQKFINKILLFQYSHTVILATARI